MIYMLELVNTIWRWHTKKIKKRSLYRSTKFLSSLDPIQEFVHQVYEGWMVTLHNFQLLWRNISTLRESAQQQKSDFKASQSSEEAGTKFFKRSSPIRHYRSHNVGRFSLVFGFDNENVHDQHNNVTSQTHQKHSRASSGSPISRDLRRFKWHKDNMYLMMQIMHLP